MSSPSTIATALALATIVNVIGIATKARADSEIQTVSVFAILSAPQQGSER